MRQRPQTGVGVANALPRQIRGRDNPVGLRNEKVDLPVLCKNVVEIPDIAGIRRAYEVEVIPGDDEERSAILPGFGVERILRCARERIDDDMATLAPPDQARPLFEVAPVKHL